MHGKFVKILVIALLLRLQLSDTKVCFYRKKTCHSLTPPSKSVRNELLVKPKDIFLPTLHIKLGPIKNYVKALDEDGNGFSYAKEKFTKFTDTKIKDKLSFGSEIRN